MNLNRAIAFVVFCFCSVTAHAVVTFDWATIGNPGNGPDQDFGDGQFGAVGYTYRISKHEVTNAQYTEFLNAVDPTGVNPNLGGADPFLYNSLMSGFPGPDPTSNANGGIVVNSGAANGSKYQVKSGRNNNPVIYVSFFDAMRFINWLENGQGSGSTESGVYTIGSGVDESRSTGAEYFIPSENEWYKAAYHKNDGVTANYWEYPISTDAVPYSDQPPGGGAPTLSNTANCFKDDGMANGYDDGYAVTGSPSYSSSQNYLTDVGAYTASVSPYGTFDQGGNVTEWNEAVINSSSRGGRGGDWGDCSIILSASVRFIDAPSSEFAGTGFRVASIPEPSSVLLGALGMLALTQRRRR